MRSAAKDFAIDRMTLKRYIDKRHRQQGTAYAPVALWQMVFPSEMEKDLADHVKQLSDMFHGLSVNKTALICHLAGSVKRRQTKIGG